MVNEIIEGLNIKPDGTYLDCTIGGGGHSAQILKHLNNNGKLIGIDKDAAALAECERKFGANKNVILVKSDFKQVETVLNNLGVQKLDGVLIDLGVSSYQLDNADRGFSFRFDAPLDMRMDKSQAFSAYDVVNKYSQQKLVRILREYGEENFATSIAKNIIKNRPVSTTLQLANIVERSMPVKEVYRRGGAHKQTFQAIRIEVNAELDSLFETINYLIKTLTANGVIAILSFHSLEDRIVKNAFKVNTLGCICPPKTPICICHNKPSLELVNKKPIMASENELNNNKRAGSAKLRMAKKL